MLSENYNINVQDNNSILNISGVLGFESWLRNLILKFISYEWNSCSALEVWISTEWCSWGALLVLFSMDWDSCHWFEFGICTEWNSYSTHEVCIITTALNTLNEFKVCISVDWNRLCGKGKCQNMDNTKIETHGENSYWENEEISGWKSHINTWKLNWYVLTITDVILNQKRVNLCEHTVM